MKKARRDERRAFPRALEEEGRREVRALQGL